MNLRKRLCWAGLATSTLGSLAAARAQISPNPTAICMAPSYRAEIRFGAASAARIFKGIGVEFNWYLDGKCPSSDAMKISLQNGSSPHDHQGALAYALPFEGTHIVVFYDRVLAVAKFNHMRENCLLGYVLAHEITHLLRGVGQHSPAGIMKAKWSRADELQMQKETLGFTSHDVTMIQLSVAARSGTRRLW